MTPDNIDNDPANNRQKYAESNRQRMTTPARQPQQEVHDQIGKLKTDLFKCIGTIESIQSKCRDTHTSPPAPARCGCDGCRKESEHLDCPTPGHCDQMKCVLCCEGSDFPTLPEEIKKYEAAAAKAAREQVDKKIALFEKWREDAEDNKYSPSHPNKEYWDGYETAARNIIESLRAQQEQP